MSAGEELRHVCRGRVGAHLQGRVGAHLQGRIGACLQGECSWHGSRHSPWQLLTPPGEPRWCVVSYIHSHQLTPWNNQGRRSLLGVASLLAQPSDGKKSLRSGSPLWPSRGRVGDWFLRDLDAEWLSDMRWETNSTSNSNRAGSLGCRWSLQAWEDHFLDLGCSLCLAAVGNTATAVPEPHLEMKELRSNHFTQTCTVKKIWVYGQTSTVHP